MIISEDPFWNVKAQENAARAEMDADIRDLEGAISLASKALALRSSPGWDQFLKVMQAQLTRRREELVLASDERAACILQGRCRELTAVLGLMKQAEDSVKTLNERLQGRLAERKDRFSGGKVKPVGAVT